MASSEVFDPTTMHLLNRDVSGQTIRHIELEYLNLDEYLIIHFASGARVEIACDLLEDWTFYEPDEA